MSSDHRIVVVLGLRNPGKAFSEDIRRGGTDVVECAQVVKYYYPKRWVFPGTRSQPNLKKIESAIQGNLNAGGITQQPNITDIVFVQNNKQGESIDLPFARNSNFLHFKGEGLFQKLVVYRYTPAHDLDLQWDTLRTAGMRVINCWGKKSDTASPSTAAVMREDCAPAVAFSLLDSRGATPASKPPTVSPDVTTLSPPSSLNTPKSAAIPSEDELPPGEVYAEAALKARRHADHAVILLMGRSGHGKSKTINRLVGQNLLPVGRTALGSTTKVINRVKGPAHVSETGVTITVAFDDTPGLEDTNRRDRQVNANLMRRYKQQCFSNGTYPNIILLVASWDSITPDAHNDPQDFTSALGKTMYSLSSSGLVDEHRSNVVVVVTKSLTSWDQFEDLETIEEKNTQWGIEAGLREGIIADLQRKLFPQVSEWPTVFIENGGGSNISAKYPTLPNGELSHQNLFAKIRSVIQDGGAEGKIYDLAGGHALDVLTGAGMPLQTTKEILVERESKPIQDLDIPAMNPHLPPCRGRVQELMDSYLGVMYNPRRGTFGRTRVLQDPLPTISLGPPGDQSQKFQLEQSAQQGENATSDSLSPTPATLKAHYSSSSAFNWAVSTKSDVHILRSIIEVVEIDPVPRLSVEMENEVKLLPPWSSQTQQKYHEFFAMYGTHIVTRLALGGIIRAIRHSTP